MLFVRWLVVIVDVFNCLFAVAMIHRGGIFSTFAVCVCDSLLFIGSVGWG